MSTPSQISIFPATSASATRVAELLQQQHPHIRLRLAARSPQKLTASANGSVSSTPFDINRAASIQDALQGSDAAYVLNPPFYFGGKHPSVLSQTFADNLVKAANETSTLNKIVFLSALGVDKTSGIGISNNLRIGENTLLTGLNDGIHVVTLRTPLFLSNFKFTFGMVLNPPHILASELPFDKPTNFIDATSMAKTAIKYLISPALTTSSSNAGGKRTFTAVQIVTRKKSIPEIAAMLSEITGFQVNALPIPEEQWPQAFKQLGISDHWSTWLLKRARRPKAAMPATWMNKAFRARRSVASPLLPRMSITISRQPWRASSKRRRVANQLTKSIIPLLSALALRGLDAC